jgi:ubiquinone/menaquinone biosynthesis C-methylase UbiE
MLRILLYFVETRLLRLFLWIMRLPMTPEPRVTADQRTLILARLRELVPEVRVRDPLSPARRLWFHVTGLLLLIGDITTLQRRRARKNDEDWTDEARAKLPPLRPYYRKNYHYQTDGYLSVASARRYDLQLEMVFIGLGQRIRHVGAALLPRFLPRGGRYEMLECGSGTGDLGAIVQAHYPESSVLITDPSVDYLRWATRKYPSLRARFEPTFFEDLSFCASASQDLVFSSFVFHEIPQADTRLGLAEAARVLKAGGHFMLIDAPQDHDGAENLFALDAFASTFHEPYFVEWRAASIEDELARAGFTIVHRQMLLFSKLLIARKGRE